MLELIILGVVLFVLGVAGTIVYDNKEAIKKFFNDRRSLQPSRTTSQSVYRDAQAEVEQLKKEVQAYKEKLLRQAKPTSSKKVDPASIFWQKYADGAETLKETVSFEDTSINSTLTLEELMAKIEKMKK